MDSKLVRHSLMKTRSQTGGAILIMVIFLSSIIFTLCLLPCFDFVRLGLFRGRQNTALEAASLAAANDLAKIVVNDPYYGFIALTDDTATGKATLAQDLEPMPIWGINTIWATCRRELLIAELVDNDCLRSYAQRDIKEADRATRELTTVLASSLAAKSTFKTVDKDGNQIKPYEDARRILYADSDASTIGETPVTKDLRLSLGWLKEPSDSCIAVPEPEGLSEVSRSGRFDRNYRAFVDIPLGKQSFYFAGFAPQTALVDCRQFTPADGKRICSIVRADATMVISANQLKLITGQSSVFMKCAACAEPGAGVDTTLPGIMRINFQDGLVPGLRTMRDLFTNYDLTQNKTDILTASGGDYPIDQNTSLTVANPSDKARPINEIFARGFFDWIRSTHNKPRLDAIVQMVDTPFDCQSFVGSGSKMTPSLLYEFDKDGRLLVTNEKHTPFLNEVVYQNQMYVLDFNAIKEGGNYWTVSCRDLVHNLGTVNGGKHGGESMPANPINWCDLPYYDGNADIATLKQKGSSVRGLIVSGSSNGCEGGSEAICADTASFRKIDNSPLPVQPRKNFYAGGLAVEFRINSPMPIGRDAPHSLAID